MFRPTHFVILFAVVLYANAFPAAPSTLAPEGPGKVPEAGETTGSRLAAPGPQGKPGSDKDLETDATVHWGYKYYGPRWGYGPGWGGRSIGWGFGIAPDYGHGLYVAY